MLTEKHLAHLRSSAISPAIIEQRGYISVPQGTSIKIAGIPDYTWSAKLIPRILHEGALAFPLYRVGEEKPYTWVLRPDLPRKNNQGKPVKYEYPPRASNILDLLPSYRAALTDPVIPCWITEGVKKADALASVYGARILPINENGVWGWRSQGRIIDDFARIIWEGRRVIIAPDGDVRHNKQVRLAVERTAKAFIAHGAKEVLICLLPGEKDAPKVGVDDYLAEGHTIAELESNFIELGTVSDKTRVSLMKHPTTKASLFLPLGYDIHDKRIVVTYEGGAKPFYSGLICVTETGRNLHTGEESATVRFNVNGSYRDISLARSVIANGRSLGEELGKAGAYVHASNGREMSRYLTEFIQENLSSLVNTNYVDRLGTVGDGALVLPAGNVGLTDTTRYTGTEIKVGSDGAAYPAMLQQLVAERWEQLAVFWGVLGFTLAGPAINRQRIGRNPVVMLAGMSGCGKSTLAHFAVGAYGDPTHTPLQIQCGSGTTTPKGIQQLLALLNGVPTHLEDVHMLMQREPDKFAGLIYDYANGQLRSYGTLDQKGGGGQELGGALIMTGEMIPEFEHTGSQRRVWLVDCFRHPPIGAAAESNEGKRRAELLDATWRRGAGTFALAVNQRIWADWASYVSEVAELAADESLADFTAWAHLFASAAVSLRIGLQVAGITSIDVVGLMRRWAGIHRQQQTERNPATDAFDRLLLMLAQSEIQDDSEAIPNSDYRIPATWRWLRYNRMLVAAQKVGEEVWRVVSNSPQMNERVGPRCVERFGDAWAGAGLIQPFTVAGKRALSNKMFLGQPQSSTQCILIHERMLRAPEDEAV